MGHDQDYPDSRPPSLAKLSCEKSGWPQALGQKVNVSLGASETKDGCRRVGLFLVLSWLLPVHLSIEAR